MENDIEKDVSPEEVSTVAANYDFASTRKKALGKLRKGKGKR